jgi:hypothetical protein
VACPASSRHHKGAGLKAKSDNLDFVVKREKAYSANLTPDTREKVKLLWRATANALRKKPQPRKVKVEVQS